MTQRVHATDRNTLCPQGFGQYAATAVSSGMHTVVVVVRGLSGEAGVTCSV